MTPPHPHTPGPRLLMTTDTVGGVWSFSMALAAELAAQRYQVVLLTLGPAPSAGQRAQAAAIPGLELRVTDLALDWMDPQGSDTARVMAALPAIEREVAPDIVHVNGHREANADWRAPVLLTSHSCVATWWQACRGEEPPEAWDAYCQGVASALDRAGLWVTPSKALGLAMSAIYQPSRSPTVIWNGTAAKPSAGRRKPLILAAGRAWDEAKGFAVLMQAAAGLPWPLALAGWTGVDEEEAAEEAGNPLYLGRVPPAKMTALMAKAEIFAAPSLYEPFGLAVLEAALTGCALVLSDIPTFRELWAGAAVFVPPGDMAMLRQRLDLLIADRPLREDMQRRARIRASRYGRERMSAAYRQGYEDLLAGRPYQVRRQMAGGVL